MSATSCTWIRTLNRQFCFDKPSASSVERQRFKERLTTENATNRTDRVMDKLMGMREHPLGGGPQLLEDDGGCD
jgi:hypothetical protein